MRSVWMGTALRLLQCLLSSVGWKVYRLDWCFLWYLTFWWVSGSYFTYFIPQQAHRLGHWHLAWSLSDEWQRGRINCNWQCMQSSKVSVPTANTFQQARPTVRPAQKIWQDDRGNSGACLINCSNWKDIMSRPPEASCGQQWLQRIAKYFKRALRIRRLVYRQSDLLKKRWLLCLHLSSAYSSAFTVRQACILLLRQLYEGLPRSDPLENLRHLHLSQVTNFISSF